MELGKIRNKIIEPNNCNVSDIINKCIQYYKLEKNFPNVTHIAGKRSSGIRNATFSILAKISSNLT